jgi:hypothetical protein
MPRTIKFPIPTPGGGGGTTSTVSPTNFSPAGFNFVDATGKVIQNVSLDATGRASYTKTFTAADVGQKTIAVQFTGDHKYKHGATDNFTMAVAKADGSASSDSPKPAVTQIVAGPGIYISAPNGQGVVTIATEPLNIGSFGHDLYDVKWTEMVYESVDGVPTLPFGTVGQFTAVGYNGSLMRSRDGFNWVQMAPTTSSYFYGVCAELDSDVAGQHLDYVAVGASGEAGYSYLGNPAGEQFQVGQLEDQDGPITSTFNSVSVFYSNYIVKQNNQFSGGLTQLGIVAGGQDTTGMPVTGSITATINGTVYTLSEAEIFRYKISNLFLVKSSGRKALIYSQGANDQINLIMTLDVNDFRILPGSIISGRYPIYLTSPTNPPVQVPVPFPPNNQYYWLPYIIIKVDGNIVHQGYYPTSWNAITFYQSAIAVPIGTAGDAGLGLGHHDIEVSVNQQGDTSAEYTFTSRLTIGP